MLLHFRYWTPSRKDFQHIALCRSGGSLVEQAALLGTELYILSDFPYHD